MEKTKTEWLVPRRGRQGLSGKQVLISGSMFKFSPDITRLFAGKRVQIGIDPVRKVLFFKPDTIGFAPQGKGECKCIKFGDKVWAERILKLTGGKKSGFRGEFDERRVGRHFPVTEVLIR